MEDKRYELLKIREDGTEVRLYPNGYMRDQNGHILELPEQLKPQQITSETAYIRHAQRKAKILHAIESRLKDVTKTNAPADAIAAIVGKRAEIAMKDDTRTGNEAAKIVLSAVDAYQDKQAEGHTTTIRNEYALDDDTKRLLYAMLQERRDNDGYTDAVDAEDTNE